MAQPLCSPHHGGPTMQPSRWLMRPRQDLRSIACHESRAACAAPRRPAATPAVARPPRSRLVALALAVALALVSALVTGGPLHAQTRVTVDLTQRHQTIEGFGACLISWDSDMERLYTTPSFLDAYIRQLGASMLRINLWGPSLPDP